MANDKHDGGTEQKSPRQWRPDEKLAVVLEAASLPDADLGAFLRRKGLHSAQLEEWRASVTEALSERRSRMRGKQSPEAQRIRQLEKELLRKDKALAEVTALLALKKTRGDLGGRGRRHVHEEREMIVRLIEEAVAQGARLNKACALVGINARSLQRWRKQDIGDDRRAGPKRVPRNKLSDAERETILKVVNAKEHRDMPVKQIVPRLADQGTYLASESTMYRILREEGQLVHRAASRPRTSHRPRELVAIATNQVWTWDITYLRSTVMGMFFYLYLVVDIFSRKIVAAKVHESENSDHAARLFDVASVAEGIEPGQLALHSDNGATMKGATLLATLQQLGISTSFSRPHVSDDNPYSESLFRTLKYRPEYPTKPFASVAEAQAWVDRFVAWYNGEHRHSAIRFVTPSERHDGRDDETLAKRAALYAKAKARHPERWSGETRNWTPIRAVYLNPERSKSCREAS